MAGPYRVPHVKIDSSLWMTNKTPVGTYRGPGRFEANFFLERMIDMIAADLGIDRIEFRRKNLIKQRGAALSDRAMCSRPTPRTNTTAANTRETLDRALQEIDWPKMSKLQGKLIDGKYHGLGVVCFIEGGAAGPKEMRADRDQHRRHHVGLHGHVVGRAGRRDGVRADRRRCARSADRAHPSRLSRLDRLCERRLRRLSLALDGDGRLGGARRHQQFHGDVAPGRRQAAGLRRVQRHARHRQGDAAAAARWRCSEFAGLTAEGAFLNKKHTYSYGAHVAHITVDAKLGRIEIVDYVVVQDVGRAVNPLTLRGQVLGSLVQGLGGAVLEDLKYDENGQFLTGSLADYLLPTATDFPNLRCVVLDDYPSPINPLGAKGAGEGGIIAAGGCMANAVANALQSLRRRSRASCRCRRPISGSWCRPAQRKAAE